MITTTTTMMTTMMIIMMIELPSVSPGASPGHCCRTYYSGRSTSSVSRPFFVFISTNYVAIRLIVNPCCAGQPSSVMCVAPLHSAVVLIHDRAVAFKQAALARPRHAEACAAALALAERGREAHATVCAVAQTLKSNGVARQTRLPFPNSRTLFAK
jgi:hypothetical protein